MPGPQDQQVLQQLLTGMNTMQMQAGLMPGGTPVLNQNNTYTAPPVMSPAEFSNNLRVQFQNTFYQQPLPPPNFGAVTPVPMNPFSQGLLPPPQMGMGFGMGRQQVMASNMSSLSNAQTLGGVGARGLFGMAATGLGTMMTGNPLIGAGIGYGADYLFGGAVERLGQLPFQPFIEQQKRAAQLQNMSLRTVRTGGDLSASGVGLSGSAAFDLERNLSQLTGNRNFRTDTGDMFNRQDMMKITRLSSQMGLLDTAQGTDQITREMGKIGRALSTFMRVVEEPDVQQALQMMGRMRNLGMSVPEMNVAASNARTYARMAGTSVQGVMQAATQGAGIFQQAGLSGATGLNVGMAATGAAGMLRTQLDPRTLSLLGGSEGIARNLMTSSAQMSQMDFMMPGLLSRGKNGQLGIDEEALREFALGKRSVTDLAQRSARRLSGGQADPFVREYSTRRNELRDEMMNSMGGLGGVLIPLSMGRSLMETGAAKNMGDALRMAGLDEEQARTLELSYESPEFWSGIREQRRSQQYFRQNERALRRRHRSETAARDRSTSMRRTLVGGAAAGLMSSIPGGTGLMAAGTAMGITPESIRLGANRFMGGIDSLFRENFAEDADLEEMQRAVGGGEMLRAYRPGRLSSASQIDALREELRSDSGAESFLQRYRQGNARGVGGIESELSRFAQAQAMVRTPGMRVAGVARRLFEGPEVGLTRLGRQGESYGDTVLSGENIYSRFSNSIAGGLLGAPAMSVDQLRSRGQEQMRIGRLLEETRDTSNVSGIQELSKRHGNIPRGELAKILGKASQAVKSYIGGQQTNLGFTTLHTGTVSSGGLSAQVKEAINSANLSPEQKKALLEDPSMVKEATRLARQGMSSTEMEFLDKLESRGANTAESMQGATRQQLLQRAETARADTLKALNVSEGIFSNAEGQKAIIDIFSDTTKRGGLKQKLLAVRALAAAGHADKAAELKAKLGLSGQYTDAEMKAAEDTVGDSVGRMDRSDLKSMGNYFNRDFEKLDGALAHARSTLQGAKEAQFEIGLKDTLGDRGAEMFRSGGVSALKEYLDAGGNIKGLSGNLRKRIMAGDIDDTEITRKVGNLVNRRTRGSFRGGLSQTADDIGRTGIEDELIDEFEKGALERASEGAGKKNADEHFSKAVDKFSSATDKLEKAAEGLGNAADMNGMRDTVESSWFSWGD